MMPELRVLLLAPERVSQGGIAFALMTKSALATGVVARLTQMP